MKYPWFRLQWQVSIVISRTVFTPRYSHIVANSQGGHSFSNCFDGPSRIRTQNCRVLINEITCRLDLPINRVEGSRLYADENFSWARRWDLVRPKSEGGLLFGDEEGFLEFTTGGHLHCDKESNDGEPNSVVLLFITSPQGDE